jgi:hypothetical protein
MATKAKKTRKPREVEFKIAGEYYSEPASIDGFLLHRSDRDRVWVGYLDRDVEKEVARLKRLGYKTLVSEISQEGEEEWDEEGFDIPTYLLIYKKKALKAKKTKRK